jgi:hypothetical protein
MGRKLTALVNARQGPWVPAHHLPSPVVEITGLPSGQQVTVETPAGQEATFATGGRHSLPDAAWFRVRASCAGVICCIRSR